VPEVRRGPAGAGGEQAFAFDLSGRSLAEMDAAWNAAKQAERRLGDGKPSGS
jgi:hypothetical protein